jgi:ribosomal protein S18 acetylase RimI-like enzyme
MIGRASLADLEIVVSWITSARECELWAGPRVGFPIDLQSLPIAIGFDHAEAITVFDADRLVAFGQLLAKDPKRGHLARVIVRPDSRGQGHAEVLAHALLERARAVGYEKVGLNVSTSNLPARVLYWKLGFREAVRPTAETASPRSLYMEIAVGPPSPDS